MDKYINLIGEEDLDRMIPTSQQNKAPWDIGKDNIEDIQNFLLFESNSNRGEIHKTMEEVIKM